MSAWSVKIGLRLIRPMDVEKSELHPDHVILQQEPKEYVAQEMLH